MPWIWVSFSRKEKKGKKGNGCKKHLGEKFRVCPKKIHSVIPNKSIFSGSSCLSACISISKCTRCKSEIFAANRESQYAGHEVPQSAENNHSKPKDKMVYVSDLTLGYANQALSYTSTLHFFHRFLISSFLFTFSKTLTKFRERLIPDLGRNSFTRIRRQARLTCAAAN